MTVRRRLNCWEYQGCGRDIDSISEGDPCPASTAEWLDGSNGGSRGGRACWVVTGTMCEGCVQGTFDEKYAAVCRKCAFYYRVEIEEGLEYEPTDSLLRRYEAGLQETGRTRSR